MQKDAQNSLYSVLHNYIPKSVLLTKNKAKSWEYGYNEKYDCVVISKTGQIGDIISINGLIIALPATPKDCYARSSKPEEQYWERKDLPKELDRIQSIFQWNTMPNEFKTRWVNYIESEFDNRENGFWFMCNGKPHYITGSHYMYLQWSSIDVGYPDYREANRIFFLFWEACKADSRSFGMVYLKIRRSGFSYMSSAECVNIGTLAKNARLGILSKKGDDAKKMFTDKVVPINSKLPFFFKPIMDGMDKPKTELAYRVPASKITKKNMFDVEDDEIKGLDTSIDWKNTEDNSYDGEKLLFLAHDESGKWVKPTNILNNWRVTKTCLRLGSKIIGKCMMGSTSNALSKGGDNFKKLYEDSNIKTRNANGQTKSGLYALFIPMEWNMEGFIDVYGMPVLRKPSQKVRGVDGRWIENGAIDYWEAEVDSLKNDSDALNEYYRQFPRTESHAFRDESKSSLFNLTKIYQQIDYNDGMIKEHYTTRGSFQWKDGVKDTEVIWSPDPNGRFNVSWIPPARLRNRWVDRGGIRYPANEHMGSFGCDSYDISAVVGGRGSNGALHGMTKFHMDEGPSNEFFLEYVARPQTAEIFFEEVLMACVFYGMPILIENNKPRLLYHFKNRGYRGFSMNRPDKQYAKLTPTERELGGIPNSSEDVRQAHAAAIESYIEKHIGFDIEGKYRSPDEMGTMPFTRTLEDWAKFDINDRTKFDASISSGLAIMANQKHLYMPEMKESKISINFARYRNDGNFSEIIS
ncbi:terminase large subunit [Caudoviricetes sp.]|nr:terminase large subunit [Caudoviricetes sp.]